MNNLQSKYQIINSYKTTQLYSPKYLFRNSEQYNNLLQSAVMVGQSRYNTNDRK
jgi:hypothetical protein